MSNFIPKLFISVGRTGAMFTLRETCMLQGRFVSSFHHVNLGQDPEVAFQKALVASLAMGIQLKTSKEELKEELRKIQRMTAEEQERLRLAAEAHAARQLEMRREIQDYQKAQIDAHIIPFGSCKDKTFEQAPHGYIRWAINNHAEFEDGSVMQYLSEKLAEVMGPVLDNLFDKEATIEIGKRIDTTVTVTNVGGFWRDSFGGYGQEYVQATTLVTPERVCLIVYSTTFKPVQGDNMRIRATVKAHKEYKGQMQTQIQRVKVM